MAVSGYARSVVDPKANQSKTTRTFASGQPVVEYGIHDRGNIQLAVGNNGTFGTEGVGVRDAITNAEVKSCIYPKNSDIVFLYVSAIWIGAVVGRDTLVSCGNEDFYQTKELWPDEPPFGNFKRYSIDINSPFYSSDAYSEQDLYCEYTDTVTDPNLVLADDTDARPHKPLHVKISQRSMAWSYSYANDFILFDYQVQNIGTKPLNDVYLGIYVDGDAWHVSREGPQGWDDDMVGFYRTHPAPEGCGFIDTVNIAYHSDADGDPAGASWDNTSVRSVLATRVIRTPSTSLKYSFNWWITNYGDASLDFGPRRMPTPEDPYRNFGTRMGTPEGDKNKYYVMRHEEFDYDLIFSALNQSHDGWLPPSPDASTFARGWDTRYLLSFGPFTINPGEKLPISFAWVGGEHFHKNPTDFATLFDPQDPSPFYNSLDFSDLAVNSRWASWIYDNPGVDTDGDGYAGKFRVCVNDSVIVRVDTVIVGTDTTITPIFQYTAADTFFYEGDGVPDFRGAGPPPSPKLSIIPSEGKLTVRWNGFYSETTPDIFSRKLDFEGYRVYMGRDNRPGSLSIVTSYDKEDYNRYRFALNADGQPDWILEETPFTLDSLRVLYNDPLFDPQQYTRAHPLLLGGESYYFAPQDFNMSVLGQPGTIRKTYPNATDPGTDSTQWTDADVTTEHGKRLPKFYEYEYVIDSLLPTVPNYIAVTTFDFGSPQANLPALESDPYNNYLSEFAQPSADSAEQQLSVFVYPNPYRIDGNYRANGFEGRTSASLPDDRIRVLNFANLPHKCTISIFSLDGDLVQTIRHDRAEGDVQSSHDEWDLITRNHQAVVSGLYYFVIESDTRTQVGKFMVIK